MTVRDSMSEISNTCTGATSNAFTRTKLGCKKLIYVRALLVFYNYKRCGYIFRHFPLYVFVTCNLLRGKFTMSACLHKNQDCQSLLGFQRHRHRHISRCLEVGIGVYLQHSYISFLSLAIIILKFQIKNNVTNYQLK